MEKSEKLSVFGVFDVILEIVLILSSGYFIFLFIVLFFPNFNYQSLPVMISLIAALMLIRIYEKVGLYAVEIVKFIGSVSFVMFFASKFVAENSAMAQMFTTNISKLEPVVNLGAITLLLTLVMFYILVRLFFVIAGYVKKFLRKIHMPNIAVAVGIFLMLFPFLLFQVDSVMQFVAGINMEIAKYLIPFFGFSLLYLHLNYFMGLARTQLRTQ